jgi:hypothetical protein
MASVGDDADLIAHRSGGNSTEDGEQERDEEMRDGARIYSAIWVPRRPLEIDLGLVSVSWPRFA